MIQLDLLVKKYDPEAGAGTSVVCHCHPVRCPARFDCASMAQAGGNGCKGVASVCRLNWEAVVCLSSRDGGQ